MVLKNQGYTQMFRAIAIVTLVLFGAMLLIGFIWDWVTALAFIIGGSFFALCCFLSYYLRTWFMFNNIPDTTISSTAALMTYSIPKAKVPSDTAAELEAFKPFTFKQDEEQKLEDMRVRALLRQVFGDESEQA